MVRRKIIQIDEAKCDGCGLCVPSCAEGAIQVVDGKARLVSDVYCDGLGACLGQCPRNAITMEDREAEAFDERAAHRHVESLKAGQQPRPHGGCPGIVVQNLLHGLSKPSPGAPAGRSAEPSASALGNWPLQLHLVPPHAPFLREADLLLAADCVPFAYADFHRRFLRDKPVVIGCPKLDDGRAYVEKLAAILRQSSIRSLTVVHMEVPCCTGLVRIAETAIALAGADVPIEDVTISIRGEILAAIGR
ncbi:MAG: 4Fe-4S binding protein [Pirellulales bacterium]|nr:4Fe-4S binding protein [Pirellulales bacterium]